MAGSIRNFRRVAMAAAINFRRAGWARDCSEDSPLAAVRDGHASQGSRQAPAGKDLPHARRGSAVVTSPHAPLRHTRMASLRRLAGGGGPPEGRSPCSPGVTLLPSAPSLSSIPGVTSAVASPFPKPPPVTSLRAAQIFSSGFTEPQNHKDWRSPSPTPLPRISSSSSSGGVSSVLFYGHCSLSCLWVPLRRVWHYLLVMYT